MELKPQRKIIIVAYYRKSKCNQAYPSKQIAHFSRIKPNNTLKKNYGCIFVDLYSFYLESVGLNIYSRFMIHITCGT